MYKIGGVLVDIKFGIKLFTNVDMQLNKETKPNNKTKGWRGFSLRGVVAQVLDCGAGSEKASSNSSRVITFMFGPII